MTDKQAQYRPKFSRLWERYDEAAKDNAVHMREILEQALDALETAERHIAITERVAGEKLEAAKQDSAKWFKAFEKAVSIGARYEERIAELEARTVKLPEALVPAIHNSGEPFMRPEPFGLYLNRDDVLKALRAAGIGIKGESNNG